MAIFTALGAAIGAAIGAGAFLTTAITAGLQIAAAIGLNMLAKALRGDPQKPTFSVQGQLQAGGDVSRSFIFGRTCTAGSLVYANTWGRDGGTPNAFLTQVIALSDMPVKTLDEVWVNGELCTLGAMPHAEYGFPVQEYNRGGKDHLWIKFYDGNQTVADPLLTSRVSSVDRPYSSTRVGRGVAYVVATYLVNQELFSGFPKFKFTLDGMRLYDPTDANQTYSDPNTWGGDGDHNPVVQLYNLLRGIYYNGDWFYGMQGVPAARLPDAWWQSEIAKCRAPVLGPDGMEPTYRSGGEIQTRAQLSGAIDAILTACQGRLIEYGGMYEPRVGAPGAAEFAFSDGDIIVTSDQSFTPFFSLDETVTGITAKYPNPAEGWNTKVAPPLYRSDYEIEAGNRRLLADVPMDLVPYPGQVQRLMKSSLAEAQRARRHNVTLPPSFWAQATPGTIVSWTSERNGYVNKLFRIDGVADLPNLDVNIDITEVDPTDYDWNQAVDYTPPIDGPVGPIRPPPQPMTGWQVLPAVIQSGAKQRPSIEVRFNHELDDVQEIHVQARFPDTLEVVFDSVIPYADTNGAVVLNGTFLSDTAYEVRGRYIPASDRPTEWSAWLPVTTPNIGIGAGELDAAINAKIEQASQQVGDLFATFRRELDDIAAYVNGQITIRTEKDGLIYQAVGARYEENRAQAELAMGAAADANGAIAALTANVLADTPGGSAEALFRIIGNSSPSGGAIATADLSVRAGFGGEMTEAALQLAAMHSEELGFYSRIRAKADQFDFVDKNGIISPLNLAVISDVQNAPIVGGKVEVDLNTRRTMYQTLLTDDAEVQFPKGAAVGSTWQHAFIGQGVPATISYDLQTYMVGDDPPAIPDASGVYTLCAGTIVSMTPPVADFRILRSGTTNLTSVRRFIISPAVAGRTMWDLDIHGPCVIEDAGTYTISPINNFLVCTVKLWGPGGSSGAVYAGGGATLFNPTPGQDTTFDTMVATAGMGSLTLERNAPGISNGAGGTGGTASGGDVNISGNSGGNGQAGATSRGGDGASAPDGGGAASGGVNTGAPQSDSGEAGNPPGGGAGGSAVSYSTGGNQYRAYSGGGGSGGVSEKSYGVGDLSNPNYTLIVGDSGTPGSVSGGSIFLYAAGAKGAPGGARIS